MRTTVALSVLALVALLALPASASTFVNMSQQEMLQESVAVVQGQILEVTSFWNDERTVIFTEALVQVREEVVGKTDATVVRVRTAGGTVNGYTIEAAGFPQFNRGQNTLLFLQPAEAGVYQVVGYRLGQYRITRDRQGAEMAVPTLEAGVQLLTADGRPAERPRTIQLDELKTQLRAQARRIPRLQQ
ncbi:MAG: hypothetical protein SX243_13760 [Acidobacteriota bacterium]|nr:hypothetical protein [Acidobacteriota bacterium]